MKTNVIKLKFTNKRTAYGRDYTYYSNTDVKVGDFVDIDGKKTGIITQINVPEEEILPFKDKAKTIMGIAPIEEREEK